MTPVPVFRSRARAALVVVLALSLMLVFMPPASASHLPFEVNSTADKVDVLPGDGLCATGDMIGTPPLPECTLRAAIQEANAHEGPDSITLPAQTYPLTIAGSAEDAAATGDLDITSDITIAGTDRQSTIVTAATLSSGDRVFDLLTGTVRVENLTARGGTAGGAAGDGGGGLRSAAAATTTLSRVTVTDNTTVYDGGGIRNLGPMTLDQVTVSSNRSTGYLGGGIVNYGPQAYLTITNSQITGNIGGDDYGSKTNGGGGIANTGGTLTMTDSAITGNKGDWGTAIFAHGGWWYGAGLISTKLTRVHISDNTTYISVHNSGMDGQWDGAAVQTNYSDLDLIDSTIDNNVSGGAQGAGVSFEGAFMGSLYVTRSTISNNSSASARAGGIWAQGRVLIENSTVTGNSAPGAGGVFAGQYSNIGDFSIVNTTVADNTATTAGAADGVHVVGSPRAKNVIVSGGANPNCNANLGSQGGNLSSDATCFTAGDLTNTDPLLGPLGDNGGETETRSPTAGSPAIDGGVNEGCPTVDQRGSARPVDGDGDAVLICDIGAVEFTDVDRDGTEDGGDDDPSDPCVPDSSGADCDSDGDNTLNKDETEAGLNDPCDPDDSGPDCDSDGDNTLNKDETEAGLNDPCDPDDSGPDCDSDGDNTLNKDETEAGLNDPCDPDDSGPDCDSDGDNSKNSADPDDANTCVPNGGGTPDADGDGSRDECDANDNDGPDGDLDRDSSKNSADPDDADNCVPNGGGSPDDDGDGSRNDCDANDKDGSEGDLDGDQVKNAQDACPNEAGAGADGCSPPVNSGGGGGGGGGSAPAPAPTPTPMPTPTPSPSPSPSPTDTDGEGTPEPAPEQQVVESELVATYNSKTDVIRGRLTEEGDAMQRFLLVEEDPSGCIQGRRVFLLKIRPGADRRVTRALTDAEGRYRLRVPEPARGRFYVRAQRRTFVDELGTEVICTPQRSQTMRIR